MISYVRKTVLITSLLFCIMTAQIYAEGDDNRDWGFNCDIPVEVSFKSPSDYRYISHKSTCGMNDDYSFTCLGNYDGGEDVIYKLEVSFTSMYKYQFILNPMGSSWTGMVLSTECPDGGSSFDDCLAYSVNEGSRPYYFEAYLIGPGTYYLMIDTWPSPDCIPEYELTIQMMYDKCWNATSVNLPADAPYAHLNQTTCGLNNFYHDTCMDGFDNGEEVLYRIMVNETGQYHFRLDPMGTIGVGIAISPNSHCPPGHGYNDCIAFFTTLTGDKIQFDLTLEPDQYYLMIDSYTNLGCIPDYDLTIDLVVPPEICGDANSDSNVSVSDAVYIINYVFVGGLEPDPLQSADVNCDNSVNVSDAVYILNWVFVGGNGPCDIDGNGVPNC